MSFPRSGIANAFQRPLNANTGHSTRGSEREIYCPPRRPSKNQSLARGLNNLAGSETAVGNPQSAFQSHGLRRRMNHLHEDSTNLSIARRPGGSTGNRKLRTAFLLLHHRVNQRVELAGVFHLDVGLVRMPAADHVHRGRVFELDGLTQVAVSVHLCGELALRIDHER